jgi:uncharacterized protein YdeI (YjbR/CyaY-like superfamily)
MAKKDPRVDAYIAKSAEFARPILKHIRKVVHAACPAVEEDIKWGAPHFMYKGMLCGVMAFKHHCAFGFWRAKELAQQFKELRDDDKSAMGQFGCIKSVKHLPSDKLLAKCVKAAAALNDSGKKPASAKKSKKPVPKMPADFRAALKRSKKAHAAFAEFSPSHQREYIEWITEAKREETRQRRIATAVEWIAAGKSRNWKYESK